MLDVEYRAIQEKVEQGKKIKTQIDVLNRVLSSLGKSDSLVISFVARASYIEYIGANKPNETNNLFSGKDVLDLARPHIACAIEKRITDLEAEFAAL